jgi:hypothetical protein
VAEQALSAPRRAGAFLDELDATAERAASASGGWEDHDLRLGDAMVRLRFAGPALVPLLGRALAHTRTAAAKRPSLTVHLWDSASTGAVPPSPPWGLDDYREQGKIRGYFGDGLYSLFQPGSEALSLLDAERGRAWFWIKAADQTTQFERAAPLRTVLHLWMHERGVQLLHAAAVGTPRGCVLLVGNAGAGKSTAALACLGSPPLRILADDYCLVGQGAEPAVGTLYSSAKATEDTLARLPFLRPMASSSRVRDEKALLFLHEHAPGRLLDTAPLRGIVVPHVAGRPETTVGPASPAAALAAVAPSTMLQLPGSGEATLRRLGEIVRAVPCHRLEVGTDPGGVADALAALLAES